MSNYTGLGAVASIVYAAGQAGYNYYKSVEKSNKAISESINNQIVSSIDAIEAEKLEEKQRKESESEAESGREMLKRYLPLIAVVGVAAIAGLSFKGGKK